MKKGLKGNSARRTKRKIARSRSPLQRQLGLEIEGRYFDLHGVFNKLNARHFGNRLRGYKVVWGRKRQERPKEYFISVLSRKKTALSASIPGSIRNSSRSGSSSTFFIMKCCTQSCPTKPTVMAGVVFTPTNSIAANASFASTNAPDVGKTKIL